MTCRCRTPRRSRRTALVAVLGVAMLTAAAPQHAIAENLFAALMGLFSRPSAPPRAPDLPLGYGDRTTDPGDPSHVPTQRYAPLHRGGTAFCVRLCDGRYFPLSRASGMGPAETCHAFCPATKTRVYWGSEIDRAVGDDGTSYDRLPNAYVYRERLVADCSCNGKDSVGLAKIDLAADPTLRTGDVVATRDGLQVFNGTSRVARRGHNFVPVENDRRLSPDLRRKLTTTLVATDQ
jgi:hypothetical protein